MERNRVLFVDDEQAILDAMQRQLRRQYTVATACGPEVGLDLIQSEGPFDVVVSDFNMPGMNGIEFLATAAKVAPDTIRIMLTGKADLSMAIEAVNCGKIFRFLTKPCEPDLLKSCLDEALEQSRLRHLEQDLLEQTVRGSIVVLTEVLALASPAAFGRATRIRDLIAHVTRKLGLPDAWKYETAALLSHIGYVSVPDDLLDRVARGEHLPAEQIAMFERHPVVAGDLLRKIPRLHEIADMVALQAEEKLASDNPSVELGARLLGAAIEFEALVSIGATRSQAMAALLKNGSRYGRRVIDAFSSVDVSANAGSDMVVPVSRLQVGMILSEDVRNAEGNLIVGKGHQITSGSLQRLHNYAELGQLDKSQLRVGAPSRDTSESAVARP